MKKRVFVLLLVLILSAIFSTASFADGYLKVNNKGTSAVDLWVLPKSRGKYLRPPKHIRSKSDAYLKYQDDEYYWLVVVHGRREEQRGAALIVVSAGSSADTTSEASWCSGPQRTPVTLPCRESTRTASGSVPR